MLKRVARDEDAAFGDKRAVEGDFAVADTDFAEGPADEGDASLSELRVRRRGRREDSPGAREEVVCVVTVDRKVGCSACLELGVFELANAGLHVGADVRESFGARVGIQTTSFDAGVEPFALDARLLLFEDAEAVAERPEAPGVVVVAGDRTVGALFVFGLQLLRFAKLEDRLDDERVEVGLRNRETLAFRLRAPLVLVGVAGGAQDGRLAHFVHEVLALGVREEHAVEQVVADRVDSLLALRDREQSQVALVDLERDRIGYLDLPTGVDNAVVGDRPLAVDVDPVVQQYA